MATSDLIASVAVIIALCALGLSIRTERRQEQLTTPTLELSLSVMRYRHSDYEGTVLNDEDALRLVVRNPRPRPVYLTYAEIVLNDGGTVRLPWVPAGMPLSEGQAKEMTLTRAFLAEHAIDREDARFVGAARVGTTTAGTFEEQADALVRQWTWRD